MFSDPLGGLDLQGLIDSFPHYVMLVDEDHTILMTNLAVVRELGMLPDELRGRKCPPVVHGVPEFDGCPLRRAVTTGEDSEHEYVDEATGERMWTAVYPTDYTTAEGRRIFIHMAKPIVPA